MHSSYEFHKKREIANESCATTIREIPGINETVKNKCKHPIKTFKEHATEQSNEIMQQSTQLYSKRDLTLAQGRLQSELILPPTNFRQPGFEFKSSQLLTFRTPLNYNLRSCALPGEWAAPMPLSPIYPPPAKENRRNYMQILSNLTLVSASVF